MGSPFMEVVQVKLLSEKLFSYLDVEDMKRLNEVSKVMLHVVRNSDEFKSRANFLLTEEVLNSHFFNAESFIWRNVSLEVMTNIPEEVHTELGKVLRDVRNIKLLIDVNHEAVDVFQFLEMVLRKANGLRSLELEVTSKIKIVEDFLDLHLHDWQGNRAEVDEPFFIKAENGGNDGIEPLQQIQRQLAWAPPKLKKLCFLKQLKYSQLNLFQLIPVIVEATKATLEELQLHCQFWDWEGMEEIVCPQLKRLRIAAHVRQRSNLEAFLSHQPSLEELDMSMRAILICHMLSGLEKNDKLCNLRSLRLKVEGFVVEDNIPKPLHWNNFLEGMPQLKEFSLSKPPDYSGYVWYGSAEAILNKLPPTMETISFQGIDQFCWDRYEGHPNNIGLLLARFRELKELQLKSCYYALTTEGFQDLIVNCPKLTSLNLFQMKLNLPEYGTGVRVRDGAVVRASLDQLTELRHLKIVNCWGVSHEDVVLVVKFEGLKTFEYCGCDKSIHKRFLLRIVQQNPRLERIALQPFAFDCNCNNSNKLFAKQLKLFSISNLSVTFLCFK